MKIAKELIRRGADLDMVAAGDYSPLLIANLGGHYEIAEELIRQGANLNLQTKEVMETLSISITKFFDAIGFTCLICLSKLLR